MTTEPRLNFKLLKQVADLLACDDATHPDFFGSLADSLAHRGFNLEARQGGIQGTYLRLVRRQEVK